MIKKLLTRTVTPLPTTNTMALIYLVTMFTAGYGIGASQAGAAIGTYYGEASPAAAAVSGADLSAEVIAAGKRQLAEARAQTAGVEEMFMEALYKGVLIPVLAIGGRIGEVGAGVGYWVASTFGVAVAETIGNTLCLSMIGVVGYDLISDFREIEEA